MGCAGLGCMGLEYAGLGRDTDWDARDRDTREDVLPVRVDKKLPAFIYDKPLLKLKRHKKTSPLQHQERG